MKQYIIIFLSIITLSSSGFSQELTSRHALGLRSSLFGGRLITDINYQYKLSAKYRLEASLGIGGGIGNSNSILNTSNSFYLQRLFNVSGGFGIYAGIGTFSNISRINANGNTPFWNGQVSVGPQIGLQYDFNKHNVPLVFSVDYRPSLTHSFNSGTIFTSGNAGIAVRYTF